MIKLKFEVIPLILFFILSVFFAKSLWLDPHLLPSSKLGKTLPSFELKTLEGGVFNSSILYGQFSLLNVFASWCDSCIEEQSFLLQLAHQGILIYGLNYKDSQKDAVRWLNEFGNPYKMIALDRKGKVAIELGVYGTPETFLIDKKGIIQYRHVGVLDESIWLKEFKPIVDRLS